MNESTRDEQMPPPEAIHKSDVQTRMHDNSGGEDLVLHHHNLDNAIRAGEALKYDAEFAFDVSMACQMTVESFRRKKSLAWDRRRQRIVKTWLKAQKRGESELFAYFAKVGTWLVFPRPPPIWSPAPAWAALRA